MSDNTQHWATADNRTFFPREETTKFEALPPGIYEIRNSTKGIYFYKRKPQNIAELVRFNDTNIDDAVKEINNFWTKRDLFKRHQFPFKRGILLHGPAGSGKSSAIKMIIEDVVAMNGIAIMFCDPSTFENGMDYFREIQNNTPVVVVIEDIDSWLMHNESEITNILDGHGNFENIVFLATTNYINHLSDRIKNRPSRFDKRIYIGPPNIETREAYLNKIVSTEEFKVPIKQWADESEGLTFAHLKELYLSVCFFDADYAETLTRLKDMISDSGANSTIVKSTNLKALAKLISKQPYDDDDNDDDDNDDDDDDGE
jgi:SpoVK/Ycf46/Vps4 family AAA+-type ATPase